MKTATIPSLRVEPELREAAESVLRNGESLSAFVEQAIRDNITHRQMQAEFIARGVASLEQARRDNEYYSPEQLLQELDAITANTDK
jgi:predicted transcriptional regulator